MQPLLFDYLIVLVPLDFKDGQTRAHCLVQTNRAAEATRHPTASDSVRDPHHTVTPSCRSRRGVDLIRVKGIVHKLHHATLLLVGPRSSRLCNLLVAAPCPDSDSVPCQQHQPHTSISTTTTSTTTTTTHKPHDRDPATTPVTDISTPGICHHPWMVVHFDTSSHRLRLPTPA